ncbi:hypothetical protein JVT61DRAFT_11047 [Boletus reticuloceps]|uniref:Zinc finger C3HC4 RING-type domain-containing protein n=1 Tax=Boletus reticuloceps TaxID=495285 RepID=A0A8I3A5U0_9AGAM|nr:hypothetical protein JVT61DRAFT_11047 [Boletus reticuloceps]
MSTTQDAIDLTTPPSVLHPLPAPSTCHNPRRHRTASPVRDGAPSGSRQKRRWLEVGSGFERAATEPSGDVGQPQSEALQPPPANTNQPSTVLAQISTWAIPPDVVSANTPRSTGEESPKPPPNLTHVDQPVQPSASVPIELSDSDDPIVVSRKADRSSSPIVEPTSPSTSTAVATSSNPIPEPLSTYTCPICFSSPTNATLTPCGHLCCGQCLFTAVKSTIRRNMVVAMDRAPPAR